MVDDYGLFPDFLKAIAKWPWLILPRNSGHLERVGHTHPGGGQHGATTTNMYSGIQAGGRETGTGDGQRISDRTGRSGFRSHAESVTALEARSRR